MDSMMLFNPSFVWPFLGIQLYCWPGMTFFWLHFVRNWLRINSRLKWIPQARHWFRLTHDSNCCPIFYSNKLMSQAKSIWFWVESWFESESYPCLKPWIGYQFLHVRNLGVLGSILLKYDALFGPWTMSLTLLWVKYICMSSAIAHIFVHLCSLTLVHRPKGVLLM